MTKTRLISAIPREVMLEGFEFVYGPVYQSLPLPLKKASALSSSFSPRESALARLEYYYETQPFLGFPEDEYRSESRAIACGPVLRLGNKKAVLALQSVKGIGPRYATGLIEPMIFKSAKEGYTPGDRVINHSESLYKELLNIYELINENLKIRRPGRSLLSPPSRTALKNLRTWWVDNGGSA